MKRKSVVITGTAIAIAVLGFVITFNPASLVASRQQANDALIAGKMSAHIGVMAYLYGYPLVDMHRQMHNETHRHS